MKKIMFNDKYGLTRAVLDGNKTMTRRKEKGLSELDTSSPLVEYDTDGYDETEGGFIVRRLWRGSHVNTLFIIPYFKLGEVIAVAQNLKDMGYNPRDTKHRSGEIWGLDHCAAWTNKMFVYASECKNRIRIADIRLERLRDISDDDCLKEGIRVFRDGFTGEPYYDFPGSEDTYAFARTAFGFLIDKVSGNGTWANNPYVFAYSFELVK